MTLFASNIRSEAEQRHFLALIVSTFDAVDVTPRGLGGAVTASSSDALPVPTAPPESPARDWTQPLLWEGEAA